MSPAKEGLEAAGLCTAPDRDQARLYCGHPLPCPHHTVVVVLGAGPPPAERFIPPGARTPAAAHEHVRQLQEAKVSRTGMLIDVVAAVRRLPSGLVWLAKRNSDGGQGGQAGMWEYPGGKVEPGEHLRQALRRELWEEFEVSDGVEVGAALDTITYNRFRVTFFEVEMPDPVRLTCHSEARWFTPAEACRVDHLPSGTIFNARHLAHVDDPARAERMGLLSDMLHTYVYGGAGQSISDEGIARIVNELERWRASLT